MSAQDAPRVENPTAKQFDEIAFLYDELMAGVPYRGWITYVMRILRRFGRRPVSILDLCCGTGSVSISLAKKGFEVTGVDISAAMIDLAREKTSEERVNVDFHVQNAAELSLDKDFDLVISLFDSLNYILERHDLRQAFRRVSQHLRPGGLLVFDMNTELALAVGFFDQDNLGCGMPLEYVWRSSYDPATRICRIKMVFTHRGPGGCRRIEMTHLQRAYDVEEVADMLREAGLTVLATYHGYTFRDATSKSDRVFFVAEK